MNKRNLLIGLVVIIVIILGAIAYRQTSRETFEAGAQLSDGEVAEIVSAVGEHILLPEDEEPLIATVADIDMLLEREPFYEGAKNGDILLLYPNAGKAILYAPDDDIIINVGPIILDEEAQGTAGGETTSNDTVLTDEEGGDASADDIPDEVQ